jgi:hypothetical protein
MLMWSAAGSSLAATIPPLNQKEKQKVKKTKD